MRLRIAFIGSRGIPPKYGGAETAVYELSKRLKKHFDIVVTCETGKFAVDIYEDIKRIHIPAFHTATITVPAIYDIIATLLTLKHADVIIYVAPDGAYAAALARLAQKKVLINTDGVEWQRLLTRLKFAKPQTKPIYLATALLMLAAEWLATKIPHITIADSLAVKKYLEHRWKAKRVIYAAYGVRKLTPPKVENLKKLNLKPKEYFLTVGRIVAENNIHTALQAIKKAKTQKKYVVVGPIDTRDPYVKYLLAQKNDKIIFTGGIYDPHLLSTLRAYTYAYIHPYTVGGTNPSLLEQLQYSRPIIAYDVPFHREILRNKAHYFKTLQQLVDLIETIQDTEVDYSDILREYTWEKIAKRYIEIIYTVIK